MKRDPSNSTLFTKRTTKPLTAPVNYLAVCGHAPTCHGEPRKTKGAPRPPAPAPGTGWDSGTGSQPGDPCTQAGDSLTARRGSLTPRPWLLGAGLGLWEPSWDSDTQALALVARHGTLTPRLGTLSQPGVGP